jgi:transposase InsO family protein
VRQELVVSERRACRTLGQHRSTQRKVPQGRTDEQRLTDDIIELADQYGRYGYRMVTGLLNNAGWCVNHKRVERIWRREGLKVPQKQKKKGRLWLKPSRDIAAQCPAGQWMAPAYGSGQNAPTTSGPTTSCRIAPLTGGSIER